MEGMNEYKVKNLVLETKEQVDEIFEETTKLGVYHLNLNECFCGIARCCGSHNT